MNCARGLGGRAVHPGSDPDLLVTGRGARSSGRARGRERTVLTGRRRSTAQPGTEADPGGTREGVAVSREWWPGASGRQPRCDSGDIDR